MDDSRRRGSRETIGGLRGASGVGRGPDHSREADLVLFLTHSSRRDDASDLCVPKPHPAMISVLACEIPCSCGARPRPGGRSARVAAAGRTTALAGRRRSAARRPRGGGRSRALGTRRRACARRSRACCRASWVGTSGAWAAGRVVSTVSTLGRVNETQPSFDRLSSQNRVMICKR